MKQCILLIVILLGSVVSAQKLHTDSYFFNQLYKNYKEVPTLFTEIPIDNFTVSSVFFHKERGKLHLGQEPKKKINFGVKTNGFYRIGEKYFWGGIKVWREYEYAKKWNLSYANVQKNGIMQNPHYYAVSKGSKWNNQNYEMEGGVSFPIVKNKINYSLSIDYILKEKYRIEYDPRPRIKQNNIKINSQLGYTFNEKHKLALGGSYGMMGVDNSISFSDKNSQTTLNYQKQLKWQLGYGTIILPTHSSTKQQQQQYQFSLGYHYKTDTDRWLFFVDLKNYGIDTYQSNNTENQRNKVLAIYFSNVTKLGSNYFHTISKNKYWNLEGNFYNEKNYNSLIVQGGKSYESNCNLFTLSMSFFEEKKGLKKEFSIKSFYETTMQKDVIAQTKTEYNKINCSLFFSKEFKFFDFILNPIFSTSYSYILNQQFINNNGIYNSSVLDNEYAKKNIHLFYDEVVFWDNFILGNNRYQFSLGGNLKKTVATNSLLEFGAEFNYESLLKGKDRQYISIHLSLFY